MDDLRTSISAILVEELEIEPDELSSGADFAQAYGADSLTILGILARLERELGIVIPTEEAAGMTTLENVLALADWHQAEAAPRA
jgi:acyl carrier protein